MSGAEGKRLTEHRGLSGKQKYPAQYYNAGNLSSYFCPHPQNVQHLSYIMDLNIHWKD